MKVERVQNDEKLFSLSQATTLLTIVYDNKSLMINCENFKTFVLFLASIRFAWYQYRLATIKSIMSYMIFLKIINKM